MLKFLVLDKIMKCFSTIFITYFYHTACTEICIFFKSCEYSVEFQIVLNSKYCTR